MAALLFWWCRHWYFYWPIAQLVERLSVKQDVVGSSPTWSVTVFYGIQNKKEGFFIIQITKSESVELQKLGYSFGNEGDLHHTYTRYKKYYFTESRKGMIDLNKIRKSNIVKQVM